MSTDSRSDTFCRAFTIIELMVVIAIVGVLVAIVLPSLFMVRTASRNVHCKSNLQQIGSLTIMTMENQYGALPYFESNMAGSAQLQRLSMAEALGSEAIESGIAKCPSDPNARRDRSAIGDHYTSYAYLPGTYMRRERQHGNSNYRKTVTSWFLNAHQAVLFSDDSRRHAESRNAFWLPDGSASKWE